MCLEASQHFLIGDGRQPVRSESEAGGMDWDQHLRVGVFDIGDIPVPHCSS